MTKLKLMRLTAFLLTILAISRFLLAGLNSEKVFLMDKVSELYAIQNNPFVMIQGSVKSFNEVPSIIEQINNDKSIAVRISGGKLIFSDVFNGSTANFTCVINGGCSNLLSPRGPCTNDHVGSTTVMVTIKQDNKGVSCKKTVTVPASFRFSSCLGLFQLFFTMPASCNRPSLAYTIKFKNSTKPTTSPTPTSTPCFPQPVTTP